MRGCSDASDVWMLPMRGCFRCLPWECFLCLDASDAYLENTSDAWMLPMLTSRMLWCCCRYQRPSPSMTTAMSWLRAFFKMAPIFATMVSLRPSPNPRGGGYIFFSTAHRGLGFYFICTMLTVRAATTQTALCGGPGPRFEPGTGVEAGTLTYRPPHLLN